MLKTIASLLITTLVFACSGSNQYESGSSQSSEATKPTTQPATESAAKQPTVLDPAYQKYIGTYAIKGANPGFDRVVIKEDQGKLVGMPNENEQFELVWSRADEFQVPEAKAKIKFVQGGNSAVKGLELTLEGKLYQATRK